MMITCPNLSKCIVEWKVLIHFSVTYLREKKNTRKIKRLQKHPMNQSNEEQNNHKNATNCYVCHCSFTAEYHKVWNHCHVTGHYRGASCNKCNLVMKMTKTIPVIFHNLKGYDSHLLLREQGKFNRKYQLYRIICKPICRSLLVIKHHTFTKKQANKLPEIGSISDSLIVLDSWRQVWVN